MMKTILSSPIGWRVNEDLHIIVEECAMNVNISTGTVHAILVDERKVGNINCGGSHIPFQKRPSAILFPITSLCVCIFGFKKAGRNCDW